MVEQKIVRSATSGYRDRPQVVKRAEDPKLSGVISTMDALRFEKAWQRLATAPISHVDQAKLGPGRDLTAP